MLHLGGMVAAALAASITWLISNGISAGGIAGLFLWSAACGLAWAAGRHRAAEAPLPSANTDPEPSPEPSSERLVELCDGVLPIWAKNIESARSQTQDAIEDLAGRFAGLPDVHYGDASHFVDGDTGISKWTLTGTTPEGRRVEVRGCDFYTFRDGLVVRKDSYWKFVG